MKENEKYKIIKKLVETDGNKKNVFMVKSLEIVIVLIFVIMLISIFL